MLYSLFYITVERGDNLKKNYFAQLDIQNDFDKHIGVVKLNETDSISLNINLIENGKMFDLSTASYATISIIKPDLTFNNGYCEIVDALNGKLSYLLPTNTVNQIGIFRGEVQVFNNTSMISTAAFSYEVKNSLLRDEGVTTQPEYPILVNLISQVNTAVAAETIRIGAETTRVNQETARAIEESGRATVEAARVTAESARVTAFNSRTTAESARVASETGRTTAESGRVTSESARVTAETSRVSAETPRASSEVTRISNEAARVSAETARATAFAVRTTAEANRVTAETARASAETLRVTAESNRVTTENTRISQETSRGTAETARVAAETPRVTNETARISAESARVTAETARATAFVSRTTAETARVAAETARTTAESARVTAESGRVSAEGTRATNFSNIQTLWASMVAGTAEADILAARTTYATLKLRLDAGDTATATKAENAELVELLQGARNYNLVNGGEIKWGVTANVLSWSKVMNIFPAGGKLVRGGASVRAITIAIGSVTLPNAGDCMYIVLPSTDNATVVPAVANVTAIPSANTLILAIRDVDSVLYFFGSGEIPYGTTQEVGGKKDAYVQTNLITAVNDVLIGLSAGKAQKKTLAEFKTIMGVDAATSATKGVVQLATLAEATTGTDTAKAVTAAGLKAVGDTKLPIGGKAADSDYLGGNHSSIFFRPRGAIGDLNNAILSGGYLFLSDALNIPNVSVWCTLQVIAGGTGAIMQIATTVDGSETFYRHFDGAGWSKWRNQANRTSRDLTLYVRLDGNDSNDGSANTASKAFRTILAAVNSLPQIINHMIIIQIADGIYGEDISLSGFLGRGNIEFRGNSSNYVAVKLLGIVAYRSTCQISISWFECLKANWVAVYVDACTSVDINRVTVQNAAVHSGFYSYRSRLAVADCVVSLRGEAITCMYGSLAMLNCTGSGNTTVLSTKAGEIYAVGTRPTGTTAESNMWGGQIR